jgi:hypothetical protein
MKRYERVNLFNGAKNFEGFAAPLTRAKDDIERLDVIGNKCFALQHILNDCYLILLYYHFETSNPEPIKPVSYFIDHGIDCTLQYFYGSWRNGYKKLPYEEPYTEKERCCNIRLLISLETLHKTKVNIRLSVPNKI